MNRLEKRQQFLKEFIEKGTQLHNGNMPEFKKKNAKDYFIR